MINERYYYSIMSTDERKVYKIIFYGLKSRTYNIVVPSFLPVDTIQEIYLRVLYDTPLFYYVNQTVIRMQGSLGNWVLLPEYLYTQNEIKQIDKELKSIVNKIKKKADQFKNNEFRLEKCLHDSVVKSVAYDYESLKKSDCFNAHSIVGAFIDRKAVCEGIAKAFKLLCNEYGIKCIVVLGKANKDGIFEDDDYHGPQCYASLDGKVQKVLGTYDEKYPGQWLPDGSLVYGSEGIHLLAPSGKDIVLCPGRSFVLRP